MGLLKAIGLTFAWIVISISVGIFMGFKGMEPKSERMGIAQIIALPAWVTCAITESILDMPSETGGNTINEELAIAKHDIKEAYAAGGIENPFFAEYSGNYKVYGIVNFDGETYLLNEDKTLIWTAYMNGKAIKLPGSWRCSEDRISITVNDGDGVIAESYALSDGVWTEGIRNRQLTKK